MKYLSLLLPVLLLQFSACAIVPSAPNGHPIVGPDGKENELVSCGTLDDCYSYARKICGGTYKIVNSNSETEAVTKFGTATSFSLLVACDSGKASYPRAARASGASQAGNGAATTSAAAGGEFAEAKTYEDCDQYTSLYKDRCREAVYARSHPGSPVAP